jgi:hypothetical protein
MLCRILCSNYVALYLQLPTIQYNIFQPAFSFHSRQTLTNQQLGATHYNLLQLAANGLEGCCSIQLSYGAKMHGRILQ